MLHAEKDRRYRLRVLPTTSGRPEGAQPSAIVVRPSCAQSMLYFLVRRKRRTLIVIPNKRSLRREESGRTARRIALFAMQ
jgi:hypothetical protein